jgi:hypothetical protein
LVGKYRSNNSHTWTLNNLKPAEITTTEATTATPTTEATTTVSDTTTAAPEEKGGCGSTVSLVSIALLPAFATFSVAKIRKKED